MRRGFSFFTFALVLSAFVAPQSVSAQDQGIPDTVLIEGGPLYVGRSVPLTFRIVNDEVVDGFVCGQRFTSAGGAAVVFDSAVWINRMADPSVMNFRTTNSVPGSGTLMIGAVQIGIGDDNDLVAGSDALALLYFTGAFAGSVVFDSAFLGGGAEFALSSDCCGAIFPQYVGGSFDIIEGALPPTVSVSNPLERFVSGSPVTFSVDAFSPEGYPLSVSNLSISSADDPGVVPTGTLSDNASFPYEVTWSSSASDIGIWKITFDVCDTAGGCTPVAIDAQAVESSEFLTSFSSASIDGYVRATGLMHGNVDGDQAPEIVGVGSVLLSTPRVKIHKYHSGGQFTELYYDSNKVSSMFAPALSYLDHDNTLDMVVVQLPNTGGNGADWRVAGWTGDGVGSLLLQDEAATIAVPPSAGVVGDFTGDGDVDYVTFRGSGELYAGSGDGAFTHVQPLVGPPGGGRAATVGDFNRDGFLDIAAGGNSGLQILFGDGAGNLNSGPIYPQQYGAADVDATYAGSDFNHDGYIDLSITTPDIGGVDSDVIVYLGDGSGSFSPTVIRRVLGQAFASAVGDFNGDGELDIAYVNGGTKRLGILFGDGTGAFTNEIRYTVSGYAPSHIDVVDLDMDGDLDIVVAAVSGSSQAELVVLENLSDPAEFSSVAMDFSVLDNAEIQISNSSGQEINSVSNTLASAEYFRRNLNGNTKLDDFVCMSAAESGAHTLSLSLKPSVSANSPTTATYQLDGMTHRLLKDEPLGVAGLQFEVYPDGSSPIMPINGAFTPLSSPSFVWEQGGVFEFEISGELSFGTLLHSAIVSANLYTVPLDLSAADTALYYWRVRPQGASEWQHVAAINVLPSSGSICGDADGNGKINVGDVTFLITHIFSFGAAPDPLSSGDANGSGNISIADAVYLISYIFASGPAPSCP